jgi:CRP-like cAMP-binding protein
MTIKEYIVENIDANFEGELPFLVLEKTFAKNETITHYNEVEQKIYFLKSGIIQVSIAHNDEIKILDFFFENHFFCAYSSLLKQTKSDVELIAISNCEVEMIDYFEIKKLHETSLLTNKLGRIINEKLYLRKVKREKEFLMFSALERYNTFLDENKNSINLIPLHKIAKYLGIHPESLSRIRKQIVS